MKKTQRISKKLTLKQIMKLLKKSEGDLDFFIFLVKEKLK